MIKLIALDLDGTLLDEQKQISAKNKQAIQQAKAQGIQVVLCTGRPIMGILSFLEELDLVSANDYCVTFNGGLVQVTGNQAILAARQHSQADIVYMYDVLSSVGLPLNMIDMEKVYEPTYPPNNRSLYPDIIKNLVFERKEVDTFAPTHTFNKALSCCPQDVLDTLVQQLPDAFKERFTLLKSRPILMEILPKGVDKAYGLKQLCDYLQIDASEVMTIGDEENDLAMITWAGYGIAMGNATDTVKQSARFVTTSNQDDGVANAIEKYALKGE